MFTRLLSPAKINLHLRVAPPNSDGYHPLLSWMTTVGLFDRLTIHVAESAAGFFDDSNSDIGVSMTCTDPSIPCDDSNLVAKAARAFRRAASGPGNTGSSRANVSVHLEKRIPSGGGLGGGSSNAATTLSAMNGALESPMSLGLLTRAAADVGSDVAFFLHGPSSVCTGRGERIAPIDPPAPKWVVLMLPDIAMPTPAVYRRFDEMRLGDSASVESQPDWNAWVKLSAEELLPRLTNDLEAPAFSLEPTLDAIRRQAEEAFGRPVRMSGSGSSLFTLFDGREEAVVNADRVSSRLNVQCLAVRLAPRVDEVAEDEGGSA